MISILIYTILLICLSFYSFVFIHPNLTMINASWWEPLHANLVHFGYLQRQDSSKVFLFLICFLTLFYVYISRKKKIPITPLHIGILFFFITIFSYPFLSNDFFNYIFDAKILTFYRQNPYFHAPQEFVNDPWLRFMDWIHRSYPYGPSFLPITIIPSFFSFGVFIFNYISFKVLSGLFYLLGIWSLQKMNKRLALIFAIHPFVLIEGLINAHNDLIAVSLGLFGLYLFSKKKKISSLVFLVLSALIKYISIPVLVLYWDHKYAKYVAIVLQVSLLVYLLSTRAQLAWYFLVLFLFLPSFPNIIFSLDIFFFGLLLSNYQFIRYGTWNPIEGVNVKNMTMIGFFILNIFSLLLKRKVVQWKFIQKYVQT